MIRLAVAADAAAIAAIYAPVVRDTHTSFEMEAPGEAEMRARIEKTLPTFPWLVDEREGKLAGYAYATKHRERLAYQWSVDVSCYVHPDYRGQRVGAGLYRALLEVLRRQGFQTAYAGVSLPNEASIRLHESVGFVPVGTYREAGYKNGAWRDTYWLQCRLGDAVANPPSPTPLSQLGLGILHEP